MGAFGFFPSHMTGNTSQLSSEVSSTDLSDILFFGTIILSFVSGAIAARIIVIWGIIHNIRLVFSQVLFVEGLLLAGYPCTKCISLLCHESGDYYFPVRVDGNS
ncbi:DUF1275 family protein [Enterobacter hormaechei]